MEPFIFINNIKYVNLGTVNHKGKKYLKVIDLGPLPFMNFFEISDQTTYENIDTNTKKELDEIYNKPYDIMYAKADDKICKMHILNVSLALIIGATGLSHILLQRYNPYTHKSIATISQLYNSPSSNTAATQLIIDDSSNFEKQLSKNKHLSDKERALLTKLNEKLTTNFEYIDFSNFYKNIASVKYYYMNREENEYLKKNKNVVAYYNTSLNITVFSNDIEQEYFNSCFSHEGVHTAGGKKDVKYTYPFERIFDEGGTELINCIICDDKKPTTYTFEPFLVKFIISIIGPRQFFTNYFSSNDEAIVSSLASNLKDRDLVIAMLSYAEEYSKAKDKLNQREADSFRILTKPINFDENGKTYADDGWTMTSNYTQSKEVWIRPEVGVDKNMWDSFTNFYNSLLTLYYNKQVEKIKSDYYINGDEWQNMLHFIADTNRFSYFFGDLCVDAFDDVDRYDYFVEGYGLVDENEVCEPVREKVNALKELYCEIHNISFETLKAADMRYQPAIINSLDDFKGYKRLTGDNKKIFDAAYNDIIVIMGTKTISSEDDFKYEQLYREAKYCVDHYKSTDNNVSLGYSRVK